MRKPAIRFTTTWVIDASNKAVVVATVTLVVNFAGQGQNVVTSRLLDRLPTFPLAGRDRHGLAAFDA